MANDWTTTRIPFDAGRRDIMVMRPETTQKASYSASAGGILLPIQSQIFRIWCSTDTYIQTGDDPSATDSGTPITGKCAEYFLATRPGVTKVSAIRMASDGFVCVTECL